MSTTTAAVYKFRAIDPRTPIPEVDRPRTLGIEVTHAVRADECGLGNIDPQHGHGRGWNASAGRSAVEVATSQLYSFPPAGSILATIRPDLDSVGAMAVLVLRHLSLWPEDLTDEDIAQGHAGAGAWLRVERIARADSFTPGAPWAPRPLPTRGQPWPSTSAPVTETHELAPVAEICSGSLPLEDRVAVVAMWLLVGAAEHELGLPDHIVDRISEACGCRHRMGAMAAANEIVGATKRVNAARRALVDAMENGSIRISVLCFPRGSFRLVGNGPPLEWAGGAPACVYVESEHRAALGLGYCIGPFVVARNPVFRLNGDSVHEKWTVASWSDRSDFTEWSQALVEALNHRERELGGSDAPTWGGGRSIVGSPQGVTSMIPRDEILEIVRRCAPGGKGW
jgi:hypothetical protein